MLGSSALRLMRFYARVYERLCVQALCAWVGLGDGSAPFRSFWYRSGLPERGGRRRVPGEVGLLDFIEGRGRQGEPVVVEDPFPVLVRPEDADVAAAGLPCLLVYADHSQGREPVLVAVVVDGVRSERSGRGWLRSSSPRAS